jgi:signal transduction histidine kinase
MRAWFKDLWKSYLDSLDPTENMAGSTPGSTAFIVAFFCSVYLALAYLPALAHLGGFPRVWGSVGMMLAAGSFTLLARRHQCRGPVGATATLADFVLYTAALALCAVDTQGTVGIAIGVVYGFAMILFGGQFYAFSSLLVIAVMFPLAVLLLSFRPALPVAFILVCGNVGMLIMSTVTRTRRRMLARQQQLEQALGAADRVADESVQAALANTLLRLGHFLHELRNYQTAVSSNLQYLARKTQLDEDSATALSEAQQAQREQEALLRSTIDDLKSRARPTVARFRLLDCVADVAADAHEIEVRIEDSEFDFELKGNPEHLRVVLLNLLRNAEQAGALSVDIRLFPDASGQSLRLFVKNDGSPIPKEARESLFDAFAVSTKPGGSGLGLYLVRRYCELLGGRIAVEDSNDCVAFSIRLPGRMVSRTPHPEPAAAPVSVAKTAS